MAEGQIRYEDVFAPDFNQGIRESTELAAQLKAMIDSLKDELRDIRSAATDSAKSIEKNNKVLHDAVEVTEDLGRLQKEHIKLQQREADAKSDQALENEKLKVSIQDLNRERRNSAKQANAVKGSMTELSLKLAENRKKYRDLAGEQKRTSKEGKALLKTIKAQDKEIKKLDDSIGNHQRHVGDYRGALRDVGGEMGLFGAAGQKVTAALGFMTKGFKSLRLALISTGIGAIVVALGSLVAYFQSTHEASVKLEKLLAPLKVTFAVLKDLAADLGEFLYNTFSDPQQLIADLWEAIKQNLIVRVQSVIDMFGLLGQTMRHVFAGEWDQAAETAKQAGSKMVDSLTGVENTIEKTGAAVDKYNGFMQEYIATIEKKTQAEIALIERTAALERENLAWTTQRAELEVQIAEHRLAAQRLQKEDAELGLARQRQAIELTKEMYDQERALAAEQLAIAEQRLAMFDSTLEDEQAVAEQRANLIRLDKQQADGLRELQERYLSLQTAVTALYTDLEVFSDEELAALDREEQAWIKLYDNLNGLRSALVDDTEAQYKREQDILSDALEEQLLTHAEYLQLKQLLDEEYQDFKKDERQAEEDAIIQGVQTTISALGEVAEAMGASAEAMKAIRIAETIINTYTGATAAYAALAGAGPAGPILAAIAAAAITAAGLANLAKIVSTPLPKFAEGTDYLTGSSDEVPIIAHRGERIVPADINRQLFGIANHELPGLLSVGMHMPELKTGLQAIESQQQKTNHILGQFFVFDPKGKKYKMNGDTILYS